MGKVLIEKLLYSCSDLKQIFILMRPKRGKSGAERLEEFGKIPLFERISREKPEVLKKLLPVYGDVINSNLGLSNDDQSLVLRETNIIFHFAATLNFEAPLKTAVEMNMRGVDIVMDLAKQMGELKVMVHFSTAFSCPDQPVLREQIYQWDLKPRDLMKTVEWLDEKVVSKIQKKLLKGHPNTYTYTKRLAEILVRDEHDKIPVCIIRPSIGECGLKFFQDF
jgi:alcohol-forming fatty acyl-CoA reductase